MLEPLRMIPGPWFLLSFLVLTMLGLYLHFIRGFGPRKPDPGVDEKLSPYAIAYLAGGSRRVIETALAMADASGLVKLNPKTRHVKPIAKAQTDDPVMRELLDELGTSNWALQRLELRTSTAIIRCQLTEFGLLDATPPFRIVLRTVATFGVLEMVAIAKLWLGITHQRPILFLTLGITALGLLIPASIVAGLARHGRRNRAGNHCVQARQLLLEPLLSDAQGPATRSDAPSLMASIFGLRRLSTSRAWAAAIPVAGLVVASNPPWLNPPTRDSGVDGSSASSGGSDSGCGGGSSGGDSGCGGGGGCGGCGGGGGD